MKIVYLYDVAGWALYNLGILLEEQFQRCNEDFRLLSVEEYHRAPQPCDVLYISASIFADLRVPYRAFAGEVVTTVHDPVEVSHFTNTLGWRNEPFCRREFGNFDRVSALSGEMTEVLRSVYRLSGVHLTPSFPNDADEIRSRSENARSERSVRFFSATNASPRHSWKAVARRLRDPGDFIVDHRGRPSLRQFSSVLIRTNRKNLILLEQLGSKLRALEGVGVQFLHTRSHIPARVEYLEDLSRSDVYVCTSNMEGGPLPLMEAVLSGLAVLTTPVGQALDWVRHGQNGFVCRTIDEFFEAASSYVKNPALLAEHCRKSREIAAAKRFDFGPWYRFITGRSTVPPLSPALPLQNSR